MAPGPDPTADPGETAAASGAPAPDRGAGGLSAFLGRVLDQLSLSSWLPAAMLVGNAALLVQLALQPQPDLAAAVRALTEDALGLLVALTFLLVLASIVTQAFEFEAIRLLEGYADTDLRPVQRLATVRIRRHHGKRRGVETRLREANLAAFARARTAMLDLKQPVPRPILDALEDMLLGKSANDSALTDAARALPWTRYVPAAELFRIEALDARAASYPAEHRLLPTRLGNVLRAAEDTLPVAPDENLEGFVLRHEQLLPPALQAEHREHRTRLDMYCSLTLVFVVLAALAAATLADPAPGWAALAALIYAGLAWLSYEAAIASAKGYGDALREIGRLVRRARAAQEAGPAAAASAAGRLAAWLHRQIV